MLFVTLLSMLGVAAAQAPNTLAVYNQGLRTASLNACECARRDVQQGTCPLTRRSLHHPDRPQSQRRPARRLLRPS